MSLRSPNAHGQVTRAILYGNLLEKCQTPIPGCRSYASLRSRNAHGHFTKTILCGNLQEKCRTPFPRTALCPSLGNRSAHDISQKTIWCSNSNEKMRGPPVNTSIEHRAPSGTVRTPQCGHTVCGKLNGRMPTKGYFQMICYNVWHISFVDTYSPFKKIAIEADP